MASFLTTLFAGAELQTGNVTQFEYVFLCGLGLEALQRAAIVKTWQSVLQRAQGLDPGMLMKITERSTEAGEHLMCEDAVLCF